MRMNVGARNRPGIVVENSDSLAVPTSPATPTRRQNIPSTSPLPSGVNISEIDLSSPLNYGTPSSMASIRTPRSGIRGTPMRARPDIRLDRRFRQVNVGSDAVSATIIRINSSVSIDMQHISSISCLIDNIKDSQPDSLFV